MRLLALGVDYRSAPASVREALAFDGTKFDAGLDLMTHTFPDNECVILSTCNRVELYVASRPEQVAETDALTDVLATVPWNQVRDVCRASGQLPRRRSDWPSVPGGGQS